MNSSNHFVTELLKPHDERIIPDVDVVGVIPSIGVVVILVMRVQVSLVNGAVGAHVGFDVVAHVSTVVFAVCFNALVVSSAMDDIDAGAAIVVGLTNKVVLSGNAVVTPVDSFEIVVIKDVFSDVVDVFDVADVVDVVDDVDVVVSCDVVSIVVAADVT